MFPPDCAPTRRSFLTGTLAATKAFDPMSSSGTRSQIMKTHHDCAPFPSPDWIPRTLKISSRRRSDLKAAIVALTTFA